MGRARLVVVVVALLSLSQSTAVIADSPEFVWRKDTLPPLVSAQRFTEYGRVLSDGGCSFTVAPRFTSTESIVTRQLAVDFRRCIAITEQGISRELVADPGAQNKALAPERRASLFSGSGGKLASRQYTWYTKSGWAKFWYADWFGSWLTRVTSNITWTLDFAGCVNSVSGSGYLEWQWGWELMSGSYYTTEVNYCPSGHSAWVSTYATFHGTINTNCYHWYQPATASGEGYNGSVSALTSGVSANCGPVFLNTQTWSGSPPG